MNILLLRAYPRKNGFTRKLTDLFVKGIRDAAAASESPASPRESSKTGGIVLIDRDIAAANIKSCIGCYRCWITTPGKCFFNDDMVTLQDDILNADIIVCATPLNSFSVGSSLKTLLDRTLPLTAPSFELSKSGFVRNKLRFPKRWPKKIALIMVGAFKDMEIFSSARTMIAQYADAVSMETCGTLLRPESFLLSFALAKPMTVKTIEAAFVRAGYEIAAEGRISSETQEKASTPLSSDIEYFKKYSNIYWEHAIALGDKSDDLDLLCKNVMTDVRILIQEMARSIDPLATASLQAVFNFQFPDKNLSFTLSVDRGACRFLENQIVDSTSPQGVSPQGGIPEVTVTCSSEVWANVFTRQINVRDALVQKQIVLEGDKVLFSKLDRYFPPPIV